MKILITDLFEVLDSHPGVTNKDYLGRPPVGMKWKNPSAVEQVKGMGWEQLKAHYTQIRLKQSTLPSATRRMVLVRVDHIFDKARALKLFDHLAEKPEKDADKG